MLPREGGPLSPCTLESGRRTGGLSRLDRLGGVAPSIAVNDAGTGRKCALLGWTSSLEGTRLLFAEVPGFEVFFGFMLSSATWLPTWSHTGCS